MPDTRPLTVALQHLYEDLANITEALNEALDALERVVEQNGYESWDWFMAEHGGLCELLARLRPDRWEFTGIDMVRQPESFTRSCDHSWYEAPDA